MGWGRRQPEGWRSQLSGLGFKKGPNASSQRHPLKGRFRCKCSPSRNKRPCVASCSICPGTANLQLPKRLLSTICHVFLYSFPFPSIHIATIYYWVFIREKSARSACGVHLLVVGQRRAARWTLMEQPSEGSSARKTDQDEGCDGIGTLNRGSEQACQRRWHWSSR